MISKQYFEETFSLATAQSLQEWANNNLIVQGIGDYGMKISYNGNISMFAETEITGLTIGNEYTLTTNSIDVFSNVYRTKINALPNDNTSTVAEMGYGTGVRTLLFTATATTMYIAIGDEGSSANVYETIDNVSLKIDGIEAVTNGTFEAGNTNGWYVQTTGDAILEAYSYVVEPTPPGDNDYLEPVNIPVYNAGDPAHLIVNSSNFSTDIFNTTGVTSFYIEPGVYTTNNATVSVINTSGTAAAKKYISLYNGNDTHPGKLNTNELAVYGLQFDGADHWVIDRQCAIDHGGVTRSTYLQYGSSNNIFNRMFANEFFIAIGIHTECHNNTIQNSRFDTMTDSSFASDVSAIQIEESGTTAPTLNVWNTKVINNEFVDCKPGRCNRHNGTQENHGQYANFNGTIIDSNTMEYTTAKYTDGNGNFTPDGDYYAGECTGWAFKSGSNDVNEPILVTNNNVWGNRPSDPTYTSLSSSGVGFQAYYGAKYIQVKNNVIFNGTTGIAVADREDEEYGTSYFEAKDNLIVDCGARPGSTGRIALRMNSAFTADFSSNTIINPIGSWANVTYNYSNNYFGYNECVNVQLTIEDSPSANCTFEFNQELPGTAESNGYTEDYVFTTDNFTNNPRTITLTNVLKP